MEGTVKFFNDSKGFGFITNNDNKKDVFVHLKGLAKGQKITEGDQVSYVESEGRNGTIAIDVKVIK